MTEPLLLLTVAFWAGAVFAISFIEAPLKFRAPGITIPLGLGIGRLVFAALNTVEAVLVVAALTLSIVGLSSGVLATGAAVPVFVAIAMLLVQVGLVRPVLMKRSNEVLRTQSAGEHRSKAHLWYVGADIVKLIALGVGAFELVVALAR